jgi:hypothetical protein
MRKVAPSGVYLHEGGGTVTTPVTMCVDRAAILCAVLRELGYRQFGPNGDCAVFADRLRAILARIDMSDAEWQDVCADAQFS